MKMKRFSILFPLLLLIVATAPLQGQISFPAFAFQDLEGNEFTPAKLDANTATMIMLFDPFCDHCETQATWIAEQADKFKNVQFVFVTLEPEVKYIEEFRDRNFGETDLDKLYFVQDVNVAFESYFGYTDDVVNIYLYHPDRKRPKYFGEETPAEDLLKYL
jgi:hypothetical protein